MSSNPPRKTWDYRYRPLEEHQALVEYERVNFGQVSGLGRVSTSEPNVFPYLVHSIHALTSITEITSAAAYAWSVHFGSGSSNIPSRSQYWARMGPPSRQSSYK